MQGIIYRVTIKISYYEVQFDFDSMDEAGKFALAIIEHHSPSEDAPRKKKLVNIAVIEQNEEATSDDDA